ncbi:MAG: hypothetical protein HND47_16635 [Chloroflexi bacterium]|nr:hypothetical protein [Chloroflexota bacterium]
MQKVKGASRLVRVRGKFSRQLNRRGEQDEHQHPERRSCQQNFPTIFCSELPHPLFEIKRCGKGFRLRLGWGLGRFDLRVAPCTAARHDEQRQSQRERRSRWNQSPQRGGFH